MRWTVEVTIGDLNRLESLEDILEKVFCPDRFMTLKLRICTTTAYLTSRSYTDTRDNMMRIPNKLALVTEVHPGRNS